MVQVSGKIQFYLALVTFLKQERVAESKVEGEEQSSPLVRVCFPFGET